MKIKVLKGHLTQQQKKAIKAIINHGLKIGKVGRTNYKIVALQNNQYKVTIAIKERLCIAAPLKWVNHYATIEINPEK